MENKIIEVAKEFYVQIEKSSNESKLKRKIEDEEVNTQEMIASENLIQKQLGISEKTHNDIILALNKKLEEMSRIKENLVFTDKEEVKKEGSKKYIQQVQEFSSNGGKGFYDVGSIVDIMHDIQIDKFEKEIEKLNQNGCDIKIIKKQVKGNPELSSYKRAASISLVMPSSNYSEYEEMMNSKYPKQILATQTDIQRESFFIPPVIYQREMIDGLIEHIRKERGEQPDRYDFAPYGYSTVKIDNWGGYANFDETRPEKKSLEEAVQLGFSTAFNYEDKGYHLNGIMPTNIVYFEEKAQEIGAGKNKRKTIVSDLKFLELEEEKPVEKRTKKPQVK